MDREIEQRCKSSAAKNPTPNGDKNVYVRIAESSKSPMMLCLFVCTLHLIRLVI